MISDERCINNLSKIEFHLYDHNHAILRELFAIPICNNYLSFKFNAFNIRSNEYQLKDDIILSTIRSNSFRFIQISLSISYHCKIFPYFFYFISSVIHNNTIRFIKIDNLLFPTWKDNLRLLRLYQFLVDLQNVNTNIEHITVCINNNDYSYIFMKEMGDLKIQLEKQNRRNTQNKQKKSENFISLVSQHLTF